MGGVLTSSPPRSLCYRLLLPPHSLSFVKSPTVKAGTWPKGRRGDSESSKETMQLRGVQCGRDVAGTANKQGCCLKLRSCFLGSPSMGTGARIIKS